MPRPERPLGPEDSALLGFAADLRRLREKAGRPTYRVGGTVSGVFFTPDGRRVAVTSNEGTIRFWDTDVEAIQKRVCELAGTPMTREEWSAQFRDHDFKPPC